ncbi:MAG: PAN domain-containing protein [Hyphomicrobiales bacterium]
MSDYSSKKFESVHGAMLALAFAALVGFHNPASAQFENNIDRPGRDYFNTTLSANAGPDVCRNLCRQQLNNGCRAWTYVRIGFQNPTRPRCWLKTQAPPAVPNRCCVSGREQKID